MLGPYAFPPSTGSNSTAPIHSKASWRNQAAQQLWSGSSNKAAVTRLIGAMLLEQHDEWRVQRSRYTILETRNRRKSGRTLWHVGAEKTRPGRCVGPGRVSHALGNDKLLISELPKVVICKALTIMGAVNRDEAPDLGRFCLAGRQPWPPGCSRCSASGGGGPRRRRPKRAILASTPGIEEDPALVNVLLNIACQMKPQDEDGPWSTASESRGHCSMGRVDWLPEDYKHPLDEIERLGRRWWEAVKESAPPKLNPPASTPGWHGRSGPLAWPRSGHVELQRSVDLSLPLATTTIGASHQFACLPRLHITQTRSHRTFATVTRQANALMRILSTRVVLDYGLVLILVLRPYLTRAAP
jgi:hypothetical protein